MEGPDIEFRAGYGQWERFSLDVEERKGNLSWELINFGARNAKRVGFVGVRFDLR